MSTTITHSPLKSWQQIAAFAESLAEDPHCPKEWRQAYRTLVVCIMSDNDPDYAQRVRDKLLGA